MSNVLVEVMPACHRASHRAARNFGSFPGNGAQRLVVDREVAEEWVLDDKDGYNSIIREARESDGPPLESPEYADVGVEGGEV